MTGDPRPDQVSGPRRLLIVDDQQHIHETFARVFGNEMESDETLSEFEARFLDVAPISGDEMPPDLPKMPSYELTHAFNCDEAIQLLQRAQDSGRPISVAFVDMRMPPGRNGIETTEELWKIDPNLQVVICTAHSDHPWSDVLSRLGYNDRLLLLKKPFESDEVRQLALALGEKSRLSKAQVHRIKELNTEVTLRRRVEDELREMAERDALTKLPNRVFLIQRLEQIISRRARDTSRHDAVMFLDLDNFKIINDSLGHDAGDDLLNQVAERLQKCLRNHDTASRCKPDEKRNVTGEETIRLGGDEFVVVLECMNEPGDALKAAKRIVEEISQPFQLNERIVNVGASVGVAFIDEFVKDYNEALRNADTAMYRAKQSGKGQVAIFDQTMHEAVCQRLELEDQLRRSVRNGDFSLRYQPIVELNSGRIAGVETLLRWTDENGRAVAPSTFIPIIEEIGLISHVGEWVIEKATREFGEMVDRLPDHIDSDVYLGVNLSSRQLSDQNFLCRLEAILNKTGFDQHRFKLEMRESLNSRNSDQSLECMRQLQERGIGLHIDDFGKGRSSLMCFQSYPVETVKIDRSFTAGIVSDNTHAVITQAIVQLAHHLGAQIVAEGVESEEQLRLLKQWGCDLAQGYYIAAPMPLPQLQAFLLEPLDSPGVAMLRRPSGPVFSTPTNSTASAESLRSMH